MWAPQWASAPVCVTMSNEELSWSSDCVYTDILQDGGADLPRALQAWCIQTADEWTAGNRHVRRVSLLVTKATLLIASDPFLSMLGNLNWMIKLFNCTGVDFVTATVAWTCTHCRGKELNVKTNLWITQEHRIVMLLSLSNLDGNLINEVQQLCKSWGIWLDSKRF